MKLCSEKFLDRAVKVDPSGNHGGTLHKTGDGVLHGAGRSGHFPILFSLFRMEKAEQDDGICEDNGDQDAEIVEIPKLFPKAQIV